MPPEYEVRFTPSAIQDISEITDYMIDVLCVPQAAHDFLTKIDEASEPLEQFPFSFPIYKDVFFSKLGYRIRPVGNYLLFYVVTEKAVEIRRVIYAKRNLPELLEQK